MTKMEKSPKNLYKYRSFGVNSLRLLSEAEIFYANPRSFNDPLDCDPSIRTDTDLVSLERLCSKILSDVHGPEKARKEMEHEKYMSTEYGNYRTDKKAGNYYVQRLRSQIKRHLDAEMTGWGVLSLASRWDSVLMWSHYAEKHEGFCIEYDLGNHACLDLKPVTYKSNRSINVSNLIDWKIHNVEAAKRSVLDTYFFAKAPQWGYEEEWRDIYQMNGAKGPLQSPFQISGVYFGLRCDPSVQTSLVKLLANRHPKIEFYNVYFPEKSSRLKRRSTDCGEIEAIGVKISAHVALRDMPDESETR